MLRRDANFDRALLFTCMVGQDRGDSRLPWLDIVLVYLDWVGRKWVSWADRYLDKPHRRAVHYTAVTRPSEAFHLELFTQIEEGIWPDIPGRYMLFLGRWSPEWPPSLWLSVPSCKSLDGGACKFSVKCWRMGCMLTGWPCGHWSDDLLHAQGHIREFWFLPQATQCSVHVLLTLEITSHWTSSCLSLDKTKTSKGSNSFFPFNQG